MVPTGTRDHQENDLHCVVTDVKIKNINIPNVNGPPCCTVCTDGTDELRLDTGASRNTGPPESPGAASLCREVIVGLAGGHGVRGHLDEAGECLLPGGQLLSFGRSVRIGRWPVGWTPTGKMMLAQLNSDPQQRVQKIFEENDHLVACVKDDVPHLSDQHAAWIRGSMSSKKCNPQKWSGPLIAQLLRRRSQATNPVPILGKCDLLFAKWVSKHAGPRELPAFSMSCVHSRLAEGETMSRPKR